MAKAARRPSDSEAAGNLWHTLKPLKEVSSNTTCRFFLDSHYSPISCGNGRGQSEGVEAVRGAVQGEPRRPRRSCHLLLPRLPREVKISSFFSVDSWVGSSDLWDVWWFLSESSALILSYCLHLVWTQSFRRRLTRPVRRLGHGMRYCVKSCSPSVYLLFMSMRACLRLFRCLISVRMGIGFWSGGTSTSWRCFLCKLIEIMLLGIIEHSPLQFLTCLSGQTYYTIPWRFYDASHRCHRT